MRAARVTPPRYPRRRDAVRSQRGQIYRAARLIELEPEIP
jgi:hypothetical protein